MAITRRPKSTKKTAGVDVDALIRKGGSSPAERVDRATESTAAVVLRVPADMLARIDAAVKSRAIKIPRHTWMLEALLEKLSREAAG